MIYICNSVSCALDLMVSQILVTLRRQQQHRELLWPRLDSRCCCRRLVATCRVLPRPGSSARFKKKLLAETESSFHFLKSRNRSWNDYRLGRSCWSKSCSSLGGFNLSDMKMNLGSSFSSSQARSKINVKHCETVKQSTINVDILTWKVSNRERPASFRDWHHAWTSEMAIQSP